MIPWIETLRQKPARHLAVLMIYVLFFMTMHVEVGGWLNNVFGGMGRGTYNAIVLGIATLVGITLVLRLSEDWKKLKSKRWLSFTILYSVLALLASYFLLMVINVEAVHFVQYAIFAILLFPFLNSYISVVITCALVGALDEAYQYLYLDTRAAYYDFNDIFLDTIGGGLGLIYLKIKGYLERPISKEWYRKVEFILGAMMAVVLVGLMITGNFSVTMNTADPAYFTLFKEVPQGFWTYPQGPYARFHILTPIPGLLLIAGSCWIYGLLGRVER